MSNGLDKLKMGSILSLNFEFEVKFDLEGQGQPPSKTIAFLTKMFCFSGPNLVILAWTGDELSRGQTSDWYTHPWTDTQDAGDDNYINPGYGLSLVDTLWSASSYRQPLEQEGNPMTYIEKFWLQISLIVAKKS